ncbi:hypothetical protein [Bradyrhizobium zhanjiangense]|uniref:hypothetical protein n=1 Tax=Bradyrhizobium zhanjiangense TaxID=1325107 RepID=UPI001FE1B18A|nr:hypothetical protein [Bradyrhizobium zhanjiangense]
MMLLIKPEYYGGFVDDLVEMHRLRHRVFKQRLDWDIGQRRYGSRCGRLRQFPRSRESLKLQQSSLSRRIDEIEHHFAIFERYSGGVRPTHAGRDVLRLARTILDEFDAPIATAKSINFETGCLTVGFCTSLSAGNLQALATRVQRAVPADRKFDGRTTSDAFGRGTSKRPTPCPDRDREPSIIGH